MPEASSVTPRNPIRFVVCEVRTAEWIILPVCVLNVAIAKGEENPAIDYIKPAEIAYTLPNPADESN